MGHAPAPHPRAAPRDLSVSKGGRFEDARQPRIGEAVYPYTGESGYECMPTVISDERGLFGRNVPLAARIKRTLRDARQTLADPDWFRKIRLGLRHLVRRCEFTNYCGGLDQRHKQVTCKLWVRLVDPGDPTLSLASDGRRRLSAPPWDPPDA